MQEKLVTLQKERERLERQIEELQRKKGTE
jgi:hypothetical protein